MLNKNILTLLLTMKLNLRNSKNHPLVKLNTNSLMVKLLPLVTNNLDALNPSSNQCSSKEKIKVSMKLPTNLL